MARFALMVGLGLTLAGCSEGQTSLGPCKTQADCPAGTFCGPAQRCTYECTRDRDCPQGKCSANGRCLTTGDATAGEGLIDQGTVVADGQPDRRTGEGLTPDLRPDGQPADLRKDVSGKDGPPLTGCAAVLGKACTQSGSECGASAVCLLTSSTAGLCTCSCTLDNPSTTANEDTCPGVPQNLCVAVPMASGSTSNYCFHACSPKLGASDCASGGSCQPGSTGLTGKPNKAVCLWPGCKKDLDCPVLTATACDTKTPSLTCGASEVCVAISSTGSTSGRCAKAGKCDLASGLCATHSLGSATAKVGDACSDDTQCGGNMFCQLELNMAALGKKGGATCSDDAECCSRTCTSGKCAAGLCVVENRNGYCTLAGCAFASTLGIRACPAGSTCNLFYTTGLCQKTCTLGTTSSCRGYSKDLLGDYECRSWDNLTIGGLLVTSGPVCDFGPSMPCNLLQSSSLDCTSVGDESGSVSNPTKMSCRGLDGKALSNVYDPLGYCLDDTSSGSTVRNPLPTP